MKEFKTKPKQPFSYVKSKQSVKTGVSRPEDEDGNLTETEKEAADVRNIFFESVFIKEPDGEIPQLTTWHGEQNDSRLWILVEEVSEQIKTL